MSDQNDIPVLTDLIESGIEIKLSDLGLDDGLQIGSDNPEIDGATIEIAAPDVDLGPIDPFENNPALEQTVRRILDEHLELAWQEIKLAIKSDLNRS